MLYNNLLRYKGTWSKEEAVFIDVNKDDINEIKTIGDYFYFVDRFSNEVSNFKLLDLVMEYELFGSEYFNIRINIENGTIASFFIESALYQPRPDRGIHLKPTMKYLEGFHFEEPWSGCSKEALKKLYKEIEKSYLIKDQRELLGDALINNFSYTVEHDFLTPAYMKAGNIINLFSTIFREGHVLVVHDYLY